MKQNPVIRITLILILLILVPVCLASNPVFTNMFTADPGAMVYNGRVYLYTGHDEAPVGGTSYVMNNWCCSSSNDMVNWTYHGTPLAVNNFSWAKADAWAGQCVYKDGKFYWYICAEHRSIAGKAIGVAVSTSPTGPFTDARGSALITNDMTKQTSISWDDIDPTVFVDDDGQAYMYWGNTVCKWVKLNSDMISFSGSINTVSLPSFTEAPWLHKRNGIYYLSYAYGWPEKIAYATSSSPTGPWTYRGIVNELVPNCGTNHQAIIDFNGNTYFIYHNGALSTGGDYRRSVCIDYLYYNNDGTMQQVVQTTQGVGGITTPTPASVATPTPVRTANPTPTPTGTSNLALNKTASADSSQTGRTPNYGNDGNATTRWCAANSNTDHWWKVDLGSSQNITRTEVMWEFARNYKYKIEVSTDNINWTVKVDKTANTSTVQNQTDNFTATARYIRITLTGLATSTWASLFEFRVF